MLDDRIAFGLGGVPSHMKTVMECDRTIVELVISTIDYTKIGTSLGAHDLRRGETAVGLIMGLPLAVPTDQRSHLTRNFHKPVALKLAIAAATTAFKKLGEWAQEHFASPEHVTPFVDERKAAAQEAIGYLFEPYTGSRWRLRRLGKLLKPSNASKTVFDRPPVSKYPAVRARWRRNDPFQTAVSMVKAFGHPDLCNVLADRDKEGWSDEQFRNTLAKKAQEIRDDALSTWQVGEITPDIADDFSHRFSESHQRTFKMIGTLVTNIRHKADDIRARQDADREKAITNAANAAELRLGKEIDNGWFKTHRQWEANIRPEVSRIIEEHMGDYNASSKREIEWLLADLKVLEDACDEMYRSTGMAVVVREEAVKLKAPSVYDRALAAADKAAVPMLLGSGIGGTLLLVGTIAAPPLVLPAVGATFVATGVYRLLSSPAKRKAKYVQKVRKTIVDDLRAKSASSPAFRSKMIGDIEKRAEMLSSEVIFRTKFVIENEARSMLDSNLLRRQMRNGTIEVADKIIAALPGHNG